VTFAFPTRFLNGRFGAFLKVSMPLGRLAYLGMGTWMIIAMGRWSPGLTVPLLACFLPTILHLALALPRSRAITERHPYLLRWIYGVPAVGVVAWILVYSVAPVMGGTDGNNLGFHLARMFHDLDAGSRNQIALGGFALAVALLGRATWSWKTRGWREAFVRRPGLTMATLLVAPVALGVAIAQCCSVLSLPEGVLDGAAFFVHATLYTEFVAARSLTLGLFPIATLALLLRAYGGFERQGRPARLWSQTATRL
jgi:hypothetical protein